MNQRHIAHFVCMLGVVSGGSVSTLALGHPANSVLIQNDDGVLAERLVYREPVRILKSVPDTMLLSNGDVLRRSGARWSQALRLRESEPGLPARASARDEAWSELVYLAPDDVAFTGPVIDVQGTAWVVLDSVANGVELAHSTGADDPWEFVQVPDVLGGGRVYPFTVDNLGVVTLLGRDMPPGTSRYELLAVRYTPGLGWGEAQRIESTGRFFQIIRATSDHQNNVIVFYDRSHVSGSPQAWNVVYDASTGRWGTPAPIAPETLSPHLPALLRTPSGHVVRVVYYSHGADIGVYIQTWNATGKNWTPPEMLPGSRWLWWDTLGALDSLPAAMDGSGNVLMAWTFVLGRWSTVAGSRYAGGAWEPSVALLPWYAPVHVGLHDGFSDAAASPAGDFMAVKTVPLPLRLGGSIVLVTFPYDRARGWLPAQAPFLGPPSPTTHSDVTWYGSGKAIASVADYGSNQQVSLFYEDTQWDRTPAVLDPQSLTVHLELESSENDVLALWWRIGESEENWGAVARWLAQ